MLSPVLFLVACEPPPDAEAPFSDAAIAAFIAFPDDDPATLVRALEQLESEVFAELEPANPDTTLRSLTPDALSSEAVVDINPRPDANPADTLPVALAWTSPEALASHDRIVKLTDHLPTEPNSERYLRSFLEGEECYPASCAWLRTENDLVKVNPSMTVGYTLFKDFRAFELSDGRSARASRGWIAEAAQAEGDTATITQSYAIEMWLEQPDATTLRLLVLWAETVFHGIEFDDDTVAVTTRIGMNQMFLAHDDWIESNP